MSYSDYMHEEERAASAATAVSSLRNSGIAGLDLDSGQAEHGNVAAPLNVAP